MNIVKSEHKIVINKISAATVPMTKQQLRRYKLSERTNCLCYNLVCSACTYLALYCHSFNLQLKEE